MPRPDHEPAPPVRSYSLEHAFAVGAPVAVAALAGSLAVGMHLSDWYAGLAKPTFAPPNRLFALVWPILYAMMSLAAWRVISLPRHWPDRRPGMVWFYIQLALNAAWPWAFFGARSPTAGGMAIVALLAAILATIHLFWKVDRVAGALLIPYVVWVGFATYLNFGIMRLN